MTILFVSGNHCGFAIEVNHRIKHKKTNDNRRQLYCLNNTYKDELKLKNKNKRKHMEIYTLPRNQMLCRFNHNIYFSIYSICKYLSKTECR